MNNRGAPPPSIRPLDGRFGAGPSRIRPEHVARLATATEWGTSHRQKPVIDLVKDIQTGLGSLFSLPAGYEIVIGNGGSTAFWAVATVSLIDSRASFASFGEFGAKFAKDARLSPWIDTTVYHAEPGSVAFLGEEGADVGAYPHNETSTGSMSPLYRAPSGLTLVDATSIAGAIEVDLSLVDAYYFAPQKVFGADGGIWIAILSPAAIERAFTLADRDNRPRPAFLDLKAAIIASRKGQTVNTPAIGSLLLLRDQIEWMLSEGGIPAVSQRVRSSAELIWQWATNRDFASLFVSNPEWRSPVVTTVDLDDDVPAAEVAAELRSAGIVDIDGYRGLGRNQLRIATFPATPPSDVAALLDCLDWVIGR